MWSVLSETKLNNMLQILEDNNVSIACITETWFDTKTGTFSEAIKKTDMNFVMHLEKINHEEEQEYCISRSL